MRALHVGEFNRLRPAVNFAGRTASVPGYGWGPRIIPDFHLIYILSGIAELRLGLQTFELRAGDIGLYGGGTPMMLGSLPGDMFEYYSIHFDWDRESPEPVHPSPRMVYCGLEHMEQEPAVLEIGYAAADLKLPFSTRAPQLEEPLSQLVEEYRQQLAGYEVALRGRMSILLTALLRHLQAERQPESRCKIAPALELLEQQPGRVWPVSELARACGYQTAYFTELFKLALGTAPKTYMMEQRLRLAKQLLLAGESAQMIAGRLGYGSTHYFYRLFKEETGMTPSEFRLQDS
ncbi:helix-turn-helix transcriptional regulator [Paenibacillus tepidiphilus]|uniref:helix-turn-helix transcriptional regulator n=1 Tax=Paenibacillus tepidiphilus TaxID=2608683 RepID=UPI00123B4D14|nr:AraC family transcriptional regulator [Paenibacillus tepidiphilus]